jgi:hypothetical protein
MPPVPIRGFAELYTALAKADRQTRLGLRAGLRDVAEPVRKDAETLAGSEIRRMPLSPKWSKMRVGVSRNLVYVAPRQRGVKTRGRQQLRRPNLADLLMDRAMQPALDRHENEIVGRFDEIVGRIVDDFNR